MELGNVVLAAQRGAASRAPDGTPLTFSAAPPSLDLGSMVLGLFPADGDAGAAATSVATLELLGSQGSAREGEALAQALDGEHLTAVGFLTRAAREGQTLTRVDATNVDAALAVAELSSEAEASIRAGVGRGLISWISETQLPFDTWDATGYVLEDSATGAGGYFVTYERLVQGLEANIVFHSPQDLDVVTAPIDVVATLEGQEIANWTLSYRAADGGPAVELASGTGAFATAMLARFDPTLLLNGLYEIVLTARDAAGQAATAEVTVAVEGEMKIGNFTLSFIDMEVPLAGLDIEVVRTYDSRDKRQGDFGIGWTLDIRQGSYRNNRSPGDGWRILATGGPLGLPCQQVQETEAHLTTVRLSDQEIYRFRLNLVNPAPVIGGCFAQARFDFVDGPLPGTTLEILGNDEVIYQNQSGGVIDRNTLELFVPQDVKLTTRDGRIFHLDLSDGVTYLEDLNGNHLEITPAGITHSSGQGIDFVRDSEERIIEIIDLAGNSIHYEYDSFGDLITSTDRSGAVTGFEYQISHYLTEIINALGVRAVRTEYNEDGRVVRMIDAFGKVTDMVHDLDSRREVTTNRLGFSRVHEYDERGNVVREADELGRATTRTFDSRGNMLTETDPLGRTTSYSYTAFNHLASVTDPLGNTTSYIFNDLVRPLTITDPRGGVNQNTYDSRGNLIRSTNALGDETSFAFDSAGGNRITETRTRTVADGSTETLVTSKTYDAVGRQTTVTAPDGSATSFSYDALGKVIRRTDAAGQETVWSYDFQGLLTNTTFADGTTQTQTYDSEGRLATRTDRAGHTTAYTYDPVGRLESITFADGAVVSTRYDAGGRLIEFTDARGNATAFAYDGMDRRIAVTDALGRTSTFTYDANGNQISATDPLGQSVSTAYDALNRPTRHSLANGTSMAFAYDALGRRTAATDTAGRVTQFAYDALDRLESVTDALGHVTTYAYDEVGNYGNDESGYQIRQTDANGRVTRFEYDRLGRVTARLLPDGFREFRTYNADGTLKSHTDFQGSTSTYQYDTENRLLAKTFPDGSTRSFTYTPTGQRATATDSRGTTTYAYDTHDRLVEKVEPNGYRLSYVYDLQGNLTALTATVGTQAFATSYSYDALNRVASLMDPLGGMTTPAYDANGNLVSLAYPSTCLASRDPTQ